MVARFTVEYGSSPQREENQLASELRVAEYTSVRQEWMSSRDAQQQTLQWTLGALAVLFAGIFASKIIEKHPVFFVGAVAGAGLISIFSQAIWFGELMRMERASLYLRGFEMASSRLRQVSADTPPLAWESWRGSPPVDRSDPWVGPAKPLVGACFLLYFVLTFAAIGILAVVSIQGEVEGPNRTFAEIAAVIEVLIFAAANVYMVLFAARQIYEDKGSAPDLKIEHEDSRELHAQVK